MPGPGRVVPTRLGLALSHSVSCFLDIFSASLVCLAFKCSCVREWSLLREILKLLSKERSQHFDLDTRKGNRVEFIYRRNQQDPQKRKPGSRQVVGIWETPVFLSRQ